MNPVEFVTGNAILVFVGIAFGAAIFGGMVWAWLYDELGDLFGSDGKHEGHR